MIHAESILHQMARKEHGEMCFNIVKSKRNRDNLYSFVTFFRTSFRCQRINHSFFFRIVDEVLEKLFFLLLFLLLSQASSFDWSLRYTSGTLVERDPEELNKHPSRLINREFCATSVTVTKLCFISLSPHCYSFTGMTKVKDEEKRKRAVHSFFLASFFLSFEINEKSLFQMLSALSKRREREKVVLVFVLLRLKTKYVFSRRFCVACCC